MCAGDDEDNVIPFGPARVIWAIGTRETLGYHSSRGVIDIILCSETTATSTTSAAAVTTAMTRTITQTRRISTTTVPVQTEESAYANGLALSRDADLYWTCDEADISLLLVARTQGYAAVGFAGTASSIHLDLLSFPTLYLRSHVLFDVLTAVNCWYSNPCRWHDRSRHGRCLVALRCS